MNKYLSTTFVLASLISSSALFSMDGLFTMERTKTTNTNPETPKDEPTSLAQIAREQHEHNQPEQDTHNTPEAKNELHSQAALVANLVGQ